MSGETVTVTPRTLDGVDRNNNQEWIDGAPFDVTGALFDPGGSIEPFEIGRAPVITTAKLYFRSTPTITAHDKIAVRGDTYQVVGRPAVWVGLPGTSVGTVVDLELVEG